jgi:hypothetical protein
MDEEPTEHGLTEDELTAEWWAGIVAVVTGGWISGLVVTIGGGWAVPLFLGIVGPLLTLYSIGKANAAYRKSATKPAFVHLNPKGFIVRSATVQTGHVPWEAVRSVDVTFQAGADPQSVTIRLHEPRRMGGANADDGSTRLKTTDAIVVDTTVLDRSATEIARQVVQYKNEYGTTNETLDLDVPVPEPDEEDEGPPPLDPDDATPEGRVPHSSEMTVIDADGGVTTTAAPSRDDIEMAVGTLSFIPLDEMKAIYTEKVRLQRDDDAKMIVSPVVESTVEIRAEMPSASGDDTAVFVSGGVTRPKAVAALHLFAAHDGRWRGRLPIDWSREESSGGCLPLALLVAFGLPYGMVLEFADHVRGTVPSPDSMSDGKAWTAAEEDE